MKKSIVSTAMLAAALCASAMDYAAPPKVRQFSKLGIVSGMKAIGKLEAMNAWIQGAGYWDEWLACQVFADDYPGFAAITNLAVQTGLVTAAEAEGVLAGAALARNNNEALDGLLIVVESDKALRERYHGGRIGQYVVENEDGRLIRVDLYGDGNVWTNGHTTVKRYKDPEKAAKEAAAVARRNEEIWQAWDAANLPPDLAELRRRQRERERERQNAVEEEVE